MQQSDRFAGTRSNNMLATGLPILMYHAVTDQAVSHTMSRVHITLDMFKIQMEWLFSKGYVAITIPEMLNAFKLNAVSPKQFVLTFDDGYLSLYRLVTPILSQYNFRATLFLTTLAVGQENFNILPQNDNSSPEGDRPLAWSELKTMQENGWDIEAHGHTHIANNMISNEVLLDEIQQCTSAVEQHLARKVSFYAFPYGRYNFAALQMLGKTGMKAGFSVHPGLASPNSDFRRLPRVEINLDDTLETFGRKVETGFLNADQKLKSAFLQATLYKNPKLKDFAKKMLDKYKQIKHRFNLL